MIVAGLVLLWATTWFRSAKNGGYVGGPGFLLGCIFLGGAAWMLLR